VVQRLYTDLGFGENPFVQTPFATREKMLRLSQQGLSSLAIADQLTRAGVPPSRMLAHHKHAPTAWSHQVVLQMLEDPINQGIATSFRHRYESMPPDAKHPRRWRRAVALPLEQFAKSRGRHEKCRAEWHACLFDRPERTLGASGG
jgi:Recombinase